MGGTVGFPGDSALLKKFRYSGQGQNSLGNQIDPCHMRYRRDTATVAAHIRLNLPSQFACHDIGRGATADHFVAVK
ncbi:MAG: hypothetical protein BA870_05140 [Desulfuromonadales bacterium C00003094]|nr:MAG: hypothetical protein BA870_05140 [Desulfuromonadales bacterium C00003094]